MKLRPLLMLGLLAACSQHSTPATAKRDGTPQGEAKVTASASEQALKGLPTYALTVADTLTAPMRAMLKGYDLAHLWGSIDTTNKLSPLSVLNGCFGPDHYRIAFVFTRVWRDSLDPALYHLTGKNNFKKRVTAFSGTLRVHQVADLKPEYLDLAEEDSLAQAYTAKGRFSFEEDPKAPGAGKFDGTGVLDFYVTPKGEIGQVLLMGGVQHPTRGQGVVYRGNWTDNKTGQRKEMLLALDFSRFAPDVLEDFSVGERGEEINPKYAKLGWNNYWENKEWWAESTKPAINL